MRTLVLMFAILACGPFRGLAAQGAGYIPAGEPVRISAPECGLWNQDGRFGGIVGDSLHLIGGDEDLACSISAVNRLEVFQGRRHWGKNTALGALIGGIGGAAIGSIFGDVGAVVGVVAGVPFGAAIGTGPYARKAALVGLGVGVVGGAATGALLGANDTEWGPAFFAIVFGVLGAPIGAFGGSAVGLLRGEDRWEVVSPASVRPQLNLTPDGRLGFSLAIPVGR